MFHLDGNYINYLEFPFFPKLFRCEGKIGPAKSPGIIHPGEIELEKALKTMSKSFVRLINITRLSQYRSDGHQSVYNNILDCVHWCLPGVPDAWNQIFYHLLNS